MWLASNSPRKFAVVTLVSCTGISAVAPVMPIR